MAKIYEENHRPVATWIPIQQFEQLQALAKKNNLKLSSYLRAIIVDALVDEQKPRTKVNRRGSKS